tara:strand:- start:633 stop:743 length:111 start_codon:yes stop_codon:yes gene_type:complete
MKRRRKEKREGKNREEATRQENNKNGISPFTIEARK